MVGRFPHAAHRDSVHSGAGNRQTARDLERNRVTTHHIEPARETLHGTFSRDIPSTLLVDPGYTVVFSTLDAGWGLEHYGEPGIPRRTFGDFRPQWRGEGHALCGPVAVRGAEPGMTLEVRIGELRTGTLPVRRARPAATSTAKTWCAAPRSPSPSRSPARPSPWGTGTRPKGMARCAKRPLSARWSVSSSPSFFTATCG